MHVVKWSQRKSSLCKWSHAFPRLTYGAIVGFRVPGARDLGIFFVIYGHTCSKSMDQPGKVANPARDQLNREN